MSDCSSAADADCCDATLNVLLVTAAVRSSTPSTRALDTVTCASVTPATATLSTPSVVGRRERSAALYTSPVPLTAAIAVMSSPSASTRTAVL